MRLSELVKLFGGIPHREELTLALCTTQGYYPRGQLNRGFVEYDAMEAGRALIEFYERRERDAMARHERRTIPESMYFRNRARMYRQRAEGIETIMKGLKES